MAVISIDFDGTCVKHKYPYVGEDIGAQNVLKELINKGHKLILLTMRDENSNTLQPAIDWFESNNIKLWGINKNPSQFRWSKSRKVYADIYIDDQFLGCPVKYDSETNRNYVDWIKVEQELKRLGLL